MENIRFITYMKRRYISNDFHVSGVILGLLWGLCSIPCNTTLWDCEAFDKEYIFHATCTKECYYKFVETVNNLFPTLCEFRIIEES